MQGDLLITRATLADQQGSTQQEDILIEGGHFTKIAPDIEAPGIPRLDASGKLALPGLVNSHTHSGENLNPGLYENLPLDVWFVHSHQITRDRSPAPEDVYTRTMLGGLQMLKRGTTTAIDFLYEAPYIDIDTLDAVVRAYSDVGLRVTILLGLADKPYLSSLPLTDATAARLAAKEAAAPDRTEMLELCLEAITRWHSRGGMTNIGLGPSAPQRCTERFLTETYALAEDNDLAWHIHVQETKSQILTAQRWYGRSFIEVLAGMSLLGPRTSVVHAVWLTNRDIELLQQTDTTMIHCLLSNLRLGDGVAPVPDLMEQGVRIALGTDGRGCDESLDMVELVKMTDVVHKVHGNHYDRWPSVDEIFEMATHNGGVPTRRAERIGRIVPGYLGDLILVSLDELAFSPLNHPLRQFVFGAASDRVHTVIVDGNIVVSEGEARRVDEAEVRSAARELAERDAKLSGDPDRAGELARVVRRMYEEIEASDVGINSYIGPSFSGRGPRT